MREAHAVATVRAAEGALMAELPDGVLMQRAAAGLAAACAGLLQRSGRDGRVRRGGRNGRDGLDRRDGRGERTGGVYGSRVVVLAGSGDNGGDALYAGARLAARGAVVTAIAAAPRIHQGGAAALRAAGGRLIDAAARPGGEPPAASPPAGGNPAPAADPPAGGNPAPAADPPAGGNPATGLSPGAEQAIAAADLIIDGLLG